ncbi:Fe2+-enterobactin ABC transporter substrate-binding protein [Pseudonocardia kunmingensis]|uniref:Iron complex transport system substrate-binding protein n=1 Tax=Pseudonocardia kunmingensis TaxID=630975 RepID=A0A543E042_9PSEU|nr:Fe2+-enterobactin ABC transporter substrate-binding protein [Pseudonocardia kunmingensis]TQM14932.1 iron complex transport system substrate-binding protein [Pseudonocardia kunmingensis]
MHQGSAARLVALVVGALLLAACGGGQPAEPATTPDTAPATRTVTHALGTAEVPQDVQRVVSASVTMTGHLLGLDVPVIATATAPPGGVADENGFFLQWAPAAVAGGVVALGGPQAPIEAIAEQRPDVIVGSAVGLDAVDGEVYSRLSQIAPTVVFDHSTASWDELAAELGAALGHEQQAAAAESEFDARAAELQLDTTHPAAALTVTSEGLNVFTAESAQGKLLQSLGLQLADVGTGAGAGAGGGDRRDVVRLAHENVGQLGDASLYVVNADRSDIEEYRDAHPVLAGLPAFAEGRVVPLGPESFRLDRFAAMSVLDRVAAAQD